MNRRKFLKGMLTASAGGLLAYETSGARKLGKLLPEAYAAKSSQSLSIPPGLVYSDMEAGEIITDVSQLKLTPLGEQYASQNKSWKPANEWADASGPYSFYDMQTLDKGNAYFRMKYYEKGWIDNNSWLDIFVDDLVTPSPVKPTPQQLVPDYFFTYFNPSQDYSGNSPGDFLFLLGYFSNKLRLLGWKAPFTSDGWNNNWYGGDVTSDWALWKASVGMSPDFPNTSPHLIYKLRMNLDKMNISNSFGFADVVYDLNIKAERIWPIELAQNGFQPGFSGVDVIPSYSGTALLGSVPVDEFGNLAETLAVSLGSSVLLSKREAVKKLYRHLAKSLYRQL